MKWQSWRVCKILQNENLVAKIGFDTDENGPSQVWVTGIPIYQHTGTGTAPYCISYIKIAPQSSAGRLVQ